MEKVATVPFPSLKIRQFSIEARNLPNYHVYVKTGLWEARILGTNKTVRFGRSDNFIPVAKTTFGKLPSGQFALASAARSSCGIMVPFHVLVKCPQTNSEKAEGRGKAEYVDGSRTCQSVFIDYDVPVISLEKIFNYKTVLVAMLNI